MLLGFGDNFAILFSGTSSKFLQLKILDMFELATSALRISGGTLVSFAAKVEFSSPKSKGATSPMVGH